MADAKITDFPETLEPADNDVLPIVDVVAVTDEKITVGSLVRVWPRVVSTNRVVLTDGSAIAMRRLLINSGIKVTVRSGGILRIF